MPARRDKRSGRWRYQKMLRLPDGSRKRIGGTPTRNTKVAAERAEREHIERDTKAFYDRLHGPAKEEKEVPTFDEWFNGRFWREWVLARRNSPSEQEAKRSIYRTHLKEAIGHLRLDEIDVGAVAEFRATLTMKTGRTGKPLSEKRINNILAVVSKALRWAEDVRLIPYAPKVGIIKTEPPEIAWLEFDQLARILEAARKEDSEWLVAVLLGADAGLRKGEIIGLRYQEDVDLTAGTITVNQQIRKGVVGPPKGRRRRAVPMTRRLHSAISGLAQIRTGFVVRNLDGSHKTCHEMDTYYRICRKAGLPERGWHTLRHTFGTHAALFGVNPWRLQAWLGHRRIDETMRYVHVAGCHMRPLPKDVLDGAAHETDPDRRIVTMLGIRANHMQKSQDFLKSPGISAG